MIGQSNTGDYGRSQTEPAANPDDPASFSMPQWRTSRPKESSAIIKLRNITDPEDPAIRAFGKLQEKLYPEPEQLIPGRYLPQLLRDSNERQRNFILLAEMDDKVVGGSIFHYFPVSNSGFSSFMAIGHEARGQGLARRLHRARFVTLNRAASKPVAGLFIDVVAPEKISDAQWALEEKVGSDPIARRRVFTRMGFRQVDIPYKQPDGDPSGGEICTLDLLYCSQCRETQISTERVVNTMRDYWRGWIGDARAESEAEKLRARAQGDCLDLLQSAYIIRKES